MPSSPRHAVCKTLSPASRELSQRESLRKVAFVREPLPPGEVAAKPTERASRLAEFFLVQHELVELEIAAADGE